MLRKYERFLSSLPLYFPYIAFVLSQMPGTQSQMLAINCPTPFTFAAYFLSENEQ